MQFQLNATVYFDGIQIYEAGLVIIEQNIDGKWACLDDKLVCKVLWSRTCTQDLGILYNEGRFTSSFVVQTS